MVEGNGNARRGPLELEVKPYLLRTRGHLLQVVPVTNWSDFESKC